MSQWYPQRSKTELAVLTDLENTVKKLARDFQGDRAFNVSNEVELAAYLLIKLRGSASITETVKGVRMHLAHLELSESNRVFSLYCLCF